MKLQLIDTFERAKAASRELALISDQKKNEVLLDVADTIIAQQAQLLEANARDLARMERSNPLYDRLMLDGKRLKGIADDMRHVAALPSPLGKTLIDKTLDNGLHLRRVSVPFGVIGMVYEARPNVSFDVFSLCFKCGNTCVLKGGRDADDSNKAIVQLIHEVLKAHGVNPSVVELLPATHEATGEMLNAVGYIDLCIPRGGKRLIDFVRDNARVPVVETGAGVVNTYFDVEGDLGIGKLIVNNAKTRRVSVCNALDCLIIHQARLDDLAELCEPLIKSNVVIHADLRRPHRQIPRQPPAPRHARKFRHGVHGLRHGPAHRLLRGRSHQAHQPIWQRSQRVHHHREPTDCRHLRGTSRCRLRVCQRTHQLHRRRTVWHGSGDWHQHTKTRPTRPHGPRGNHHLQVAHRGTRTGEKLNPIPKRRGISGKTPTRKPTLMENQKQ